MSEEGLARAGELAQVGEVARAQQLVRSHLAEHPDDARGVFLHAHLSLMAGDAAEAERAALLVAGTELREGAARILTGALLAQGRPDEAAEWARVALALAPEDWSTYLMYASVQEAQGDRQGAQVSAHEGVEVATRSGDPADRARALVGYARILLSTRGRPQLALQAAEEALSTEPSDLEAASVLALAQLASRRAGPALATSLSVLRQTPLDAGLPVVARYAVHILLGRFVGRLLLLSIPLVYVLLGGGEALDAVWPSDATNSGFDLSPGVAVASRVAGALGLGVVALVGRWTFGPLIDPAVRTPVLRYARRRVSAWIQAVLVGLAVLLYLVALVLGFPFAIPMVPMLMLFAWILQGYAAWGLPR
ncbi:hypothetical protein [Microbacterium marinilacus]|uniref:Tetratricopeptide repeat protein n=1 Tax=Microbacterium marinilacus TaxID=415209 RepID=A0ABP7BVY2_9MICO|nr:hypothetical protein [Microbacterium marinilacus]MBY0688192.1 hypothetical protein [Microbacterium marinilacus]